LRRDPGNSIAARYGATITPQVFVKNANGQVVYSGRIDNRAYEVGRQRKIVTSHDLSDFLDNMLAGNPQSFTQTKAIGCFIE
jgi:hypothetical protein